MRGISSMTVSQNGIEIVAADGSIWSTTRDQVLLMLAANSQKNVLAALKQSLAGFLDVAPDEIADAIGLTVKLTGEMTLTLVSG